MKIIHCVSVERPFGGNKHILQVSDAAALELEKAPKPTEENQNPGSIVCFNRGTRTWWAVRKFPCFTDSFDCCCAARAMELPQKGHRVSWPKIEFPECCKTCGGPLVNNEPDHLCDACAEAEEREEEKEEE